MHRFLQLRSNWRLPRAHVVLAALVLIAPSPALAQTLLLKDGRTLTGRLGQTAGIAESPDQKSPQAGQMATRPILIVDDSLRRTFVPKIRVEEILNKAPERLIKIPLWQQPAGGGGKLLSVSPSLSITHLGASGRRTSGVGTRAG